MDVVSINVLRKRDHRRKRGSSKLAKKASRTPPDRAQKGRKLTWEGCKKGESPPCSQSQSKLQGAERAKHRLQERRKFGRGTALGSSCYAPYDLHLRLLSLYLTPLTLNSRFTFVSAFLRLAATTMLLWLDRPTLNGLTNTTKTLKGSLLRL
jgi:hypothetical protein